MNFAAWKFYYGSRPAPVEHKPAVPVTCAKHLRGRVYRNDRGQPYMEVVNSKTGGQIVCDGPFRSWEHAVEVTAVAVGAARLAWIYDFKQKDLK